MDRRKKIKKLKEELLRWTVVIGVVLISIINRNITIPFYAFVSFLGLKEFFSIINLKRADKKVVFFLYCCIPVQYILVYLKMYSSFIIFIPVYAFVLLCSTLIVTKKKGSHLKSGGIIYWGVMINLYSLGYLAYLSNINLPEFKIKGSMLILFLVLTTELNYFFQNLITNQIGFKKLLPSITTGKTLEGFIGGVVVTTLIGVPLGKMLVPGFGYPFLVVSGLVIGVLSFVGEAFMGAVKKELKIKETGQLIPGKGGLLDGIDRLIFSTPIYFHMIVQLYLS